MKTNYIVTVLLFAILGFGGCKKTDKSAECDIKTFTVDGKTWQIEGLNITGSYEKGASVGSLTPIIAVSEGATWVSSPANAPYDFSNDKTVKITVTAENGKANKTYTARAMVSLN